MTKLKHLGRKFAAIGSHDLKLQCSTGLQGDTFSQNRSRFAGSRPGYNPFGVAHGGQRPPEVEHRNYAGGPASLRAAADGSFTPVGSGGCQPAGGFADLKRAKD